MGEAIAGEGERRRAGAVWRVRRVLGWGVDGRVLGTETLICSLVGLTSVVSGDE